MEEEYSPEILEKIKNLPSIPVGKAKDFTGQKFGHLTVLKRAPKDSSGAYWWCICDCPEHNIVCRLGYHLTDGRNKSCGCEIKKQIAELGYAGKRQLAGNKYGKLTVLEDSGLRDSGGSVIWKCQCDCGKITYVNSSQLVATNPRHRIRSCGCTKKSLGEEKIENILKENNISYKKEFQFSDLVSQKGVPLRFDFAIFSADSLIELIEYDGEQHFQAVEMWGGEEGLKLRILYDNLKNEYCKKHNIKLVRISYNKIDNIDLKMLELDSVDRY